MLTCPYTPEHNAVIERIWRTISEAAIAMLLTAELPEKFWQEARKCAGHVYNRMVCAHPEAVSYTHLTLPTIYSV